MAHESEGPRQQARAREQSRGCAHQQRRLPALATRHARRERQPQPAQRGCAESARGQPQADQPQQQRERVQAQQTDERDDHVDMAVVDADHLAGEAQPCDHDQRHQCHQHPRCPLTAACELSLQAHALAQLVGAFNDSGVAVGAARGCGAQGRRVVERPVLFGPSDRFGDHRIRKSRLAQCGGGQQSPFFFANDAPAQESRGGARKLCPAHDEACPRTTGPRTAPLRCACSKRKDARSAAFSAGRRTKARPRPRRPDRRCR
ncbi:hypothetical protein FQZ97_939110 [compost metagenome]